MKKLVFYGLLTFPAFGFSQGKTIFSVFSVTPKNAQVLNFETSLKVHVAKYHDEAHRQVVFQTLSGPNTGDYSILEGPFS